MIQNSNIPSFTTPFETNNLQQITTSNFLDGNTDTNLTGLSKQSELAHTVEEEVGSLVEHKDIIPSETVSDNLQQLDQTTIVTKQFHENILEQEEENIMVSNELGPKEIDSIKQLATDFVKSLSQEALEIVKEKVTPDFEYDIPQVKVTVDGDSGETEVTEVALESSTRQEEISEQFQFQTSFRSHFVSYFDEDSHVVIEDDEISKIPQDISSEEQDGQDDQHQYSEERSTDHFSHDATDFSHDKPSSNKATDASEDIWAEDLLKLFKGLLKLYIL